MEPKKNAGETLACLTTNRGELPDSTTLPLRSLGRLIYPLQRLLGDKSYCYTGNCRLIKRAACLSDIRILAVMVQSLGDTFLIVRLALILWLYLGPGGRWLFKFMRLVIYAGLLMPGFIQV